MTCRIDLNRPIGRVAGGHGARRLRRVLIVAQVAATFVLLVGAGLLFASFRRVLRIAPGFSSERVLTASVNVPRTRYTDDDALLACALPARRATRIDPLIALSEESGSDKPWAGSRRLIEWTRMGGGGMSLLKRLMGRTNEAPKVRTRICVECGMPIADHKDWCSILQGQIERNLRAESPSS